MTYGQRWRVEVAESNTVFDVMTGASITWTDITDYVHVPSGITCTRGAQPESTAGQAGTMSLTLKSIPDGIGGWNTVSLSVRTPIRLSWYDFTGATYGTYADVAAAYADYAAWADDTDIYAAAGDSTDSGFVPIWTGSITEWSHEWQGGRRGLQRLTCADNVYIAQKVKLEALPVEFSLASSPDNCWPLDDVDGTRNPRDLADADGETLSLTEIGVPPEDSALMFGAIHAPGHDYEYAESTALKLEKTSSAGGYCLQRFRPDTQSLIAVGSLAVTVSLYFYIEAGQEREMVLYSGTQTTSTQSPEIVDIGVSAAGKGFVTIPGLATYTGTTVLEPGLWHHIAWTKQLGSSKLYINGTLESDQTFIDPLSTATELGARLLRIGASCDGTRPFGGAVAVVSQYSSVLTSTVIESLAAARNGYSGDTTGARFKRLGNTFNATTGSSSAGRGTMGSQATKGRSLAQAFDDISNVEHAPWYCSADGTLTLSDRSNRYNATTSSTGGMPLAASVIDESTELDTTDEDLVNRQFGYRPGGPTHLAEDATSIATYGTFEESTTYAAGSEGEVDTYVAYSVANNKDPKTKMRQLTIDINAMESSTDLPTLLSLEPGALLEITGLPSDVTSSIDLWVEGLQDRIGTGMWTRTITTSNAPADTSAWILDTDVLDTGTILAL